jgi:hypothetical protein
MAMYICNNFDFLKPYFLRLRKYSFVADIFAKLFSVKLQSFADIGEKKYF